MRSDASLFIIFSVEGRQPPVHVMNGECGKVTRKVALLRRGH